MDSDSNWFFKNSRSEWVTAWILGCYIVTRVPQNCYSFPSSPDPKRYHNLPFCSFVSWDVLLVLLNKNFQRSVVFLPSTLSSVVLRVQRLPTSPKLCVLACLSAAVLNTVTTSNLGTKGLYLVCQVTVHHLGKPGQDPAQGRKQAVTNCSEAETLEEAAYWLFLARSTSFPYAVQALLPGGDAVHRGLDTVKSKNN